MSGLITDLSALASGSVDRTTDVLEIVDVSANTSLKITVNNLVGISGGSVVSTSDSQSLTNKTLDNTNTVTVKDTLFTIQDDGDATKQARFQASSITTSTMRTYTLPDATTTLVGTGVTQTLTNKTLTAPTITGGTIDNATVTVDSIAGHTSSTIVTVAGLQISGGVVGSNGVATASIADTAVTPAKLQAGTGTGWAYATWVPVWTGVTIGNAVVTAKFGQTGKTVECRISVVFGTTTTTSSDIVFTLPVTAVSYAGSADVTPIGTARCFDTSATLVYNADIAWHTTTQAQLRFMLASGTYVSQFSNTGTAPTTWATGDEFGMHFTYEAA